MVDSIFLAARMRNEVVDATQRYCDDQIEMTELIQTWLAKRYVAEGDRIFARYPDVEQWIKEDMLEEMADKIDAGDFDPKEEI